MKSRSNKNISDTTSFDYAGLRRAKRAAAATALASRVRVPVDSAMEMPRVSKPKPYHALGFGLLALLFHGSIVAALMTMGNASPEKTITEKVVFQVVEVAAEEPEIQEIEPVEPTPVEEVDVAVEPEIIKEQPTKKPPIKRRVKRAMADPLNEPQPDEPPDEKRRAVVGITMSSTVTGGSGPSYAVGNTRMGQTGSAQSTQKAEPLARGKRGGASNGSVDASPNRKATFIPTATASFTKPKRISQGTLPYPESLKAKGIEGNVVVLIVINEAGVVQKVRVLKSSGYREFDSAALKAAKKELYRPAVRDGKAVEYNLKYTYRFRMIDA